MGDLITTYLLFQTIAGNTPVEYILAILVTCGSLIVIRILRKTIKEKLEHIETHLPEREGILLDNVKDIPLMTYIMISVYMGSLMLALPDWMDKTLHAVFLVLVISQIGLTFTHIISDIFATHLFPATKSRNLKQFLNIFLGTIVWLTVALLILSNLGIAITPLLTSLWVVGIAVAFALQNILEDIFSSISIYLDSPFQIGDYIEVEGVEGTVTSVGIKTTRIKTIRGEEVVIANRKLTWDVIHNMGAIKHRSVAGRITLVYNTPANKLLLIEKLLNDIVDATDDVVLERMHLIALDASGITYEYLFTIFSNEFEVYLDKNQSILAALLIALNKNGLEMAYPTQMLYHTAVVPTLPSPLPPPRTVRKTSTK